MSGVLNVKHLGKIVIATLNRPDKANSLNRELMLALSALIHDLEVKAYTDSPHVLVITGAGEKVFSAGADISELNDISAAKAREQMRFGQNIFERLENLPIPVLVAINGIALGGGLELAMSGDIRIIQASARCGQPEIQLGNLPGWGGTQRLPRLIGKGIALELMFTGKVIDASRAYEIGLVNEIAENALSRTIEIAHQISDKSPTALLGIKHAVNVGLNGGTAVGVLIEADAVGVCCETAAQREAIHRFLNRKEQK